MVFPSFSVIFPGKFTEFSVQLVFLLKSVKQNDRSTCKQRKVIEKFKKTRRMSNFAENIPILSSNEWFERLTNPAQRNPFWPEYLACYSSWVGGIVRDPALFVLPIDDHLVHRGDGVFEALKMRSGKIYLVDPHLDRLMLSAESIGMKKKWDKETIRTIIHQTVAVANVQDAYVRIYLSRGPGDFSVSPYDSIDPQLYVIVSRFKAPSPEKYAKGIRVGLSSVPPKQKWMGKIKCCNYLPNVLMKREAIDNGYDFVVGVDEDGAITESATENLIMLDQNNVLVHPPLDGILKGTTMIRLFHLATEKGYKTEVRPFSVAELKNAKEVMMVGTTLDVIPIVEFDHTPIADGTPGEHSKVLNELILGDQRSS